MPEPGRRPARHPCVMTSGRVGFISYLDTSDVLVMVVAFYLTSKLAQKLTDLAPVRVLLLIGVLTATWFINFALKKRLAPYPRIVEYVFNWWFNGVDFYAADVDTQTPPLIVTEQMRVGHAMDDIEARARQVARQTRSTPADQFTNRRSARVQAPTAPHR